LNPGPRIFLCAARQIHSLHRLFQLHLNDRSDEARLESNMADSDDYEVGYGRPPKATQFKKGQSGNRGGRRRKSGPIKIDPLRILDEVFPVRSGDQVKHMSAKEVELRRILKRAIQDRHLPAMIHLLDLFEKHGCTDRPQTDGVITLPTNSMPRRMAYMILDRFPILPKDWEKRHIAWGRKQYEATMTDREREYEAAGIFP
jgi:hypothetical protein